MQPKTFTGSCLCKAVAYTFVNDVKVFQYCHCSRCRKFTGSAHAANIIVEPDSFQWLRGEEFVSRYELPDAAHFATCFCEKCGSSLPWITKSATAVVVPAGSLDEDPGVRPRQNIFYADKAPWYVSAETLKKYATKPTR